MPDMYKELAVEEGQRHLQRVSIDPISCDSISLLDRLMFGPKSDRSTPPEIGKRTFGTLR